MNEKLIKLNEDKSALAKKYIGEISSALGMIAHELNDKSTLEIDLITNCMKVTEFNLNDLCKTLGVETNGTDEINERYRLLREANQRVRDLEMQIGQSQTPEVIQSGIKALSKKIEDWWDFEGFGHTGKFRFHSYGLEGQFNLSLYGNFSLTMSKTPVSDKERKFLWYESLKNRGFELVMEEGERDPSLKDSDQNRKCIIDLFEGRMPSAEITGFESKGRKGQFALRDVNVFIRNYEDIQLLPSKEGSISES